MAMPLKVWCETDVGLRRENNQDSFLIDDELGVFIVADGMGGHKGGEVASALAVETVQSIVRVAKRDRRHPNPRELLLQSYQESSARIYERSQNAEEDLRGMGTTMVVAFQQNHHLYLGNVGDSRAYLFAAPLLWQLTEDHSLINEQIRAGLIKEDEISEFMPKNVITRSVGYEREVIPDFYERPLREGELYLICSDGLTGMVDDLKITEILLEEPPDHVPARCIEEANKNGGDDNITVMVISVQ